MRFVRALPCIVTDCGKMFCDASHVSFGPNERGVGMKVSDFQVVPHCRQHHMEWEERRGFCAGWSKELRWNQAREWVEALRLRATPGESLDQAFWFAEMGLGRIVANVVTGAWTWIPVWADNKGE